MGIKEDLEKLLAQRETNAAQLEAQTKQREVEARIAEQRETDAEIEQKRIKKTYREELYPLVILPKVKELEEVLNRQTHSWDLYQIEGTSTFNYLSTGGGPEESLYSQTVYNHGYVLVQTFKDTRNVGSPKISWGRKTWDTQTYFHHNVIFTGEAGSEGERSLGMVSYIESSWNSGEEYPPDLISETLYKSWQYLKKFGGSKYLHETGGNPRPVDLEYPTDTQSLLQKLANVRNPDSEEYQQISTQLQRGLFAIVSNNVPGFAPRR